MPPPGNRVEACAAELHVHPPCGRLWREPCWALGRKGRTSTLAPSCFQSFVRGAKFQSGRDTPQSLLLGVLALEHEGGWPSAPAPRYLDVQALAAFPKIPGWEYR